MRRFKNLVRDALLMAGGALAAGCSGIQDSDGYSGAQDAPLGELAQALVAANSCVCVAASCGNGAIGGANGEIDNGISTESVLSDYRPDFGGNQASGWACRTVGLNSCVCASSSCGNGAIGGANGDIDTNISTASVLKDYGPDRIGAQQTGWKCRLSEI